MRYAISPEVLYQELPGEGVLLSLATAEYFLLNPLGKSIWELLGSGLERDAIESALVHEYEAPAETIRTDLSAFLDRMLELGLITVSPQ
jgi:hypothetical protein